MIESTAPGQMTALDSAYHFAIALLRSEFNLDDGNEIAGIAAAYALAHWPDWMDEPGQTQELDRVKDALALVYQDNLDPA